jgi:hypothetical protein
MKTVKVIAYPIGLSDTDLAIFSQNIYAYINGNVNFSSLGAWLMQLGVANTNLNNAILAQKPGDKTSTSLLHAAANEAKRILRALAANVEFVSNNDEAIALSSGYGLKKPGVRDAKTFNAKQGITTGTVDLEINSYGTAAYMWEMSVDPIATWSQIEITVKSKTTVTGLVAGTKYWFRVAVITSKGKNDYTDPHMVHVI